ncbi:protein SSU72 [Pyronema domesticum]|nr:protein SSU72 [Pyronema domesticum]
MATEVVQPTPAPEQQDDFPLKFCTVCASNQNRSMEAHLVLSLARYPVISFGTGSQVRLPGPSISQPNVFPFNSVTYDAMYNQLKNQDARLYTANGLLNMLDRNRHIKGTPERWQDWKIGVPRLEDSGAIPGPGPDGRHAQGEGIKEGVVDVVITCEERCWDAVVDDLTNRLQPLNKSVHVINVDIKDNHEEAIVGGKGILDLANMLTEAAKEEREKAGELFERGSVDARVPEVLGKWQEKWPGLPAIWTVGYF